jgi:hypothetical protein
MQIWFCRSARSACTEHMQCHDAAPVCFLAILGRFPHRTLVGTGWPWVSLKLQVGVFPHAERTCRSRHMQLISATCLLARILSCCLDAQYCPLRL